MHNNKHSTRLLSAASFAVAMAATGAGAATVSNWQFDDGVPDGTASTLVTEANAPALNAAAGTLSDAPFPTFSSDRPGARIWASALGPLLNTTNSASLRFNPSGFGGSLSVPDNDPLLRATNLTVEAFIKVGGHAAWAQIIGKMRADVGGLSWNIDFDDAGHPRIRIDSQPLGEGGVYGFNQEFRATVNVEDGQWHHVAFTYSHADKAVKLYVDYVLSVSDTSAYTLVYDASELRIGAAWGSGAFNGWIDEVRITDEVLTPWQFMTVQEPTSTRGYWTFDDGAPGETANTLTSVFYGLQMQGTAIDMGGGKPTFSSDRPPATTALISDGLNGPVVNLNTGSLFFANSRVQISGASELVQLTNLTAEAFIKVNSHVTWPLVIGKARADGDGTSWNLDFDNAGHPRVRIDSQPLGVVWGPPDGFNENWASSVNVEDGQWHHVAFTYSHAERAVRIYVDYVLSGGGTSTSTLVYDSGALLIGQGGGAFPFNGWIDEVRLTDRVLTPAEFLHTVPIKGTLISVN